MYVYEHIHRVRYRECDPMGFVYHAHYVDFLEVARTEAIRNLGISVKELEHDGIILPVINLEIAYKRSAHYDDVLTIKCFLPEMPVVRFRTEYEVYREGEIHPITTAKVVLCFFDVARKQPTSAPDALVRLLEPAIANPTYRRLARL